jgi:hypothetical protein
VECCEEDSNIDLDKCMGTPKLEKDRNLKVLTEYSVYYDRKARVDVPLLGLLSVLSLNGKFIPPFNHLIKSAPLTTSSVCFYEFLATYICYGDVMHTEKFLAFVCSVGFGYITE